MVRLRALDPTYELRIFVDHYVIVMPIVPSRQ
jgi:hypothetical protein